LLTDLIARRHPDVSVFAYNCPVLGLKQPMLLKYQGLVALNSTQRGHFGLLINQYFNNILYR